MTLGCVRTKPLRFADTIFLLIGHSCKARKGHRLEIASFFAIPKQFANHVDGTHSPTVLYQRTVKRPRTTE